MDLGHTIMAMKGDRIAKAQCRTCKKDHAYKPPKGITEPDKEGTATTPAAAKKTRGGSKKAAADAAGSPVELEWEKLMNQHKGNVLKTYGIKVRFDLGDRIKHPTFGDGVVTKHIYPNKIEVVFQMDLKVLIHGGTH